MKASRAQRRREQPSQTFLEKLDNLQEQIRLQHLLIVSLMQKQNDSEARQNAMLAKLDRLQKESVLLE